MDPLTIASLIIVLIPSLIYLYYLRSFSYFTSRKIPHDKPTFPFGNVNGIGRKRQIGEVIQKYYNKFKSVDKVCGVYFFSQPVYVLCELDLIKDVLVKNFNAFHDRGFYYNERDDPLSAHLVALSGEKWKKVRAQLTPTFTSGKMKYMFPTIVEVTNRFTDYLRTAIKSNDELEMKDILARFTIDVIGTVAFGIECNSLQEPNNEFREMSRKAIEKPRHSTLFTLFMLSNPTLARLLRIKSIRDDVSDFFIGVVRSTIEYRQLHNIERSDFLNILMNLKCDEKIKNSGTGLTTNEIAAEAFVFFIAGFETSSLTLVFALYELARNRDVQTKARKEITKMLNKYDGQLNYEAMMNIPYIDQIINETLRMYPPFPLLRRIANKDYKIPGSMHTIRKGKVVVVPVFGIHHDPDYFPRPERFDPNRFSNEESKNRNPMAWLAFGDGPRNCIGLRFAMMQVRIGLIELLRNFEFTVCDKTTNKPEFIPSSVVLSPKHGIHLKLKPLA